MKILMLLSIVFTSHFSWAISHLKNHEVNASSITLWQTTDNPGLPAFIRNPRPELIIYNYKTEQTIICDKNIFTPFVKCDRNVDTYLPLDQYLAKYHALVLGSITVKMTQRPAWVVNGQTIYTPMADITVYYSKMN
jgi:hypothetical protein